jgi:hypothetical protein
LQSIAHSLPSSFSCVSFEESTYGSYLSALRKRFPVGIIPVMREFSRFVLHKIYAFICPSLQGTLHAAPVSKIGREKFNT